MLNKKINLFMDVGPSPQKKYSNEYQAGALSFEFYILVKKFLLTRVYIKVIITNYINYQDLQQYKILL